ncbi:hypothetical protein L7F22_015541 [Adiantum nelumboides]|nr:hypothetical protein [Adiantum nelumboides]
MGDQIAPSHNQIQTAEEIRGAFDVFDINKNGSITVEELRTVMSVLGQSFTDRELRETLRQVDCNGNGTIELEEFSRVIVHEASRASFLGQDDISSAFCAFDMNQDGFISSDELLYVLQSLGETPSREDVLGMIEQADQDGDGRLSFPEFQTIMAG